MGDPLTALPAEITLRILDFTAPAETSRLTRLNKSWHGFIDGTHQDHIYSSTSKTEHPPGCRDFSFLRHSQSFAKYYEGVAGWKDLCKRQALLRRNWLEECPTTRESVVQVGSAPIWRFRPDFKRRFIISTSQSGGVKVTDMDDGRLLWELGRSQVRPYAHLEYQDGMAAWDRWGNSIEIWKADDNHRGVFQRTAILHHDCETRGFQLSYKTLCVVSSQGAGFIYDMAQDPPVLRTHADIENAAIGHLYQNEDVVVYSIGIKGYHVHSKDTGQFMGVLQPNTCTNMYHIRHPKPPPNTSITATMMRGATETIFPPQHPRKDRLVPLRVESGSHPDHPFMLNLAEDEWGAGMMQDNFMVGVSRAGRVYICSDWKGALASPERAAATSAIIDCESDGLTFDLGGWLSINNGRILFEINDRVYVLTLNQDGPLPEPGNERLPVWATLTSSAPQLIVPVSFMALYDDCLMTTFTTLGWQRSANADLPPDAPAALRRPNAFPTKAIRIISLAPDLAAGSLELEEHEDEEDTPADIDDEAFHATNAFHPGILQLVSLLDDPSDDDQDDDDEDEDDNVL